MQATLALDGDRQDGSADRAAKDAWRPIHYLGSKLRALPALETAISSVAPAGAPVCDLFAGSGTVSAWLARSRPVTAVDIQEYSRVLAQALLRPARVDVDQVLQRLDVELRRSGEDGTMHAAVPLIEAEARAMSGAEGGDLEPLAVLLEAGSPATFRASGGAVGLSRAMAESRSRLSRLPADPADAMVLRHFGGAYFSYRQAAELDVVLAYAHRAAEPDRTTLIAAVLATASELVNTVGKHFAQPLRPRHKDGSVKRRLYDQAARDRLKQTLQVFGEQLSRFAVAESTPFRHEAIRSDFADHLGSGSFSAEVVYADPPYTRDHYSRFYHVLETMALRDNPAVSTNTAHGQTLFSRGVYRLDRHQSPFCIRSEAPKAFETLFRGVASKGVPLIVSYSPYASEKNAHPRVMTMESVTELARGHFASVEATSVGTFSHSRLNRSGLNKDISYDAEHLLICRP